MLIAPLVLANLVYLVTFDHIPSALRLMMAGGIGVGYIAVGLVGTLTRPHSGTIAMLAGACLIFLSWGLGDILDPFEPMRRQAVPEAGIRYAVALMSGIAILSFPEQVPARGVAVLGALTIAVALLVAATQPFVALGDMHATRFSSFTGSPMAETALQKAGGQGEGLHSSSYVIALIGLMAIPLGVRRRIPLVAAGLMFLAAVVLLLGYKVRTAQVLVLAFLGTLMLQHLARRSRSDGLASGAAVGAMFAAGALALLYMFTTWSSGDLDDFSSGRTSTYVERFTIIDKRALASVMFGSGPGSDYTYSGVWWWAPKNSHNDFLMMLMESGIVGLIGLLLYLAGMVRRIGPWGLPFAIAICATSAISNGLFGRSTIMPLLFVAATLWMVRGTAASPVAVARPAGPPREPARLAGTAIVSAAR